MGATEIKMKYRKIRSHLQDAKCLLDDGDEVDRHLALVLDHIAETVLRIEHLSNESGNVFSFSAHVRNHPSKVRLNMRSQNTGDSKK